VVVRFLADNRVDRVVAVSRQALPPPGLPSDERLLWHRCDYSEASVAAIIEELAQGAGEVVRVVVCNGMLHRGELGPEKSLEQVSSEGLLELYETNAVFPMRWISALVKPLRKSPVCVVAVLSARVGSIADNRLGGWYSYRASKAALNMLLRTAAVEYARRAPGVKIMAFHPGTTDTPLSQPFQKNVAPEKLFAPGFVADMLARRMDEMQPDGELSFVDWAGRAVAW
jgi:NAD(P)-dependent dehydrogenase (short-subunit alcohol dehydrogenase family)